MAGDAARRKWWAVGLVGLLAFSGAAWWFGSRSQSPEQAAAKAAEPEASWITAPVERRVLTSTVVVRGDVRPEVAVSVAAPSSIEGTAVVTGIPVTAGSDVVEGTKVVEVSGRPVFVLQGEVPVYRSLKPGMVGADVQQLQDALARLGYLPDLDGRYGEATKAAVQSFYLAAGYEPVATSETAAADIAAALQAVNDAEAALKLADAELAASGKGSAQSEIAAAQAAVNTAQRALDDASANYDTSVATATVARDNAVAAFNRLAADPAAAPADVEAANAAKVEAQGALDTAIRQGAAAIDEATDQLYVAGLALTEARKGAGSSQAVVARDNAAAARDSAQAAYETVLAANGPTVAQGEVVFVPTVPARVQSAVTALGPVGAPAGSGGGGEGGAPPAGPTAGLVELSAGGLVVSTSIRAGDEGLVRVGMPVELLDETTNTKYPGTLSAVAETASTDASGQLGRAAVVTPDEPLPTTLAGVNLRITVTAAATEGEVLVVPLAAVSSAADGKPRVSVLTTGDADPVDVPVTAGLSADGFVAVESVAKDGLKAGDAVVVGK
jgi:multidrug efflux pump subunit AcrA (membrane-fusion protein)